MPVLSTSLALSLLTAVPSHAAVPPIEAFPSLAFHVLPQLAQDAFALASRPMAAVAAVRTLPEVIDGLRAWIMGILAAVATLFLVIGGLRYMTAAGDPAAVEQAKGSFKAALTGYALAVLAPVILQVLQGILGG